MATIFVRVKDKETHQESDITYKSYHDVKYRYDLIGQVDEQGNLMESDPNLQPQHQRKVPAKSPAVVETGLMPMRELTPEDFKPVINSPDPPARTGADTEIYVSGLVRDFPADTFHVEPTVDSSGITAEPTKERKKPGPKPKNKEQ